MARVPHGALLVTNSVSTAPGFHIGNVFVLAGVPAIARAMLEALALLLPQGPVVHAVTITADIGEGLVAEGLAAIQKAHPEVAIGSYPHYPAAMAGFGVQIRWRAAATWHHADVLSPVRSKRYCLLASALRRSVRIWLFSIVLVQDTLCPVEQTKWGGRHVGFRKACISEGCGHSGRRHSPAIGVSKGAGAGPVSPRVFPRATGRSMLDSPNYIGSASKGYGFRANWACACRSLPLSIPPTSRAASTRRSNCGETTRSFPMPNSRGFRRAGLPARKASARPRPCCDAINYEMENDSFSMDGLRNFSAGPGRRRSDAVGPPHAHGVRHHTGLCC